MRPRTCCCAAIAEVLRTDLAWPSVLCRRSLDSLGDPRDHPALFKRRFLVFQCHAFKVAAFKGPARRFCGRLVEASKACAVERLIAFLDAFSERIFGSERDVDLDLRGAQVLLRLVLVVEGKSDEHGSEHLALHDLRVLGGVEQEGRLVEEATRLAGAPAAERDVDSISAGSLHEALDTLELGAEGHGSTDKDQRLRAYRLVADFFARNL